MFRNICPDGPRKPHSPDFLLKLSMANRNSGRRRNAYLDTVHDLMERWERLLAILGRFF